MNRLVALLLAALLPSTGCSWIFMTKAPQPVPVPNYPLQCSDSSVAPVLDTICAAYFAVNIAALAGATTCENARPGVKCVKSDDRSAAIGIDLAIIGLCVASASSGYISSARCGEAKTQNALCITGSDEACRQLNPAWTRPPLAPPPGFQPVPPPAGQAPAPSLPPVPAPGEGTK